MSAFDVLAVMDVAMKMPCATDLGPCNTHGYVVVSLPEFREIRAAVEELVILGPGILHALRKNAKANERAAAASLLTAALARITGEPV